MGKCERAKVKIGPTCYSCALEWRDCPCASFVRVDKGFASHAWRPGPSCPAVQHPGVTVFEIIPEGTVEKLEAENAALRAIALELLEMLEKFLRWAEPLAIAEDAEEAPRVLEFAKNKCIDYRRRINGEEGGGGK